MSSDTNKKPQNAEFEYTKHCKQLTNRSERQRIGDQTVYGREQPFDLTYFYCTGLITGWRGLIYTLDTSCIGFYTHGIKANVWLNYISYNVYNIKPLILS